MEVLAAVAGSVPTVLLLAEKVSKHLEGRGNSKAKDSVEKLKNMLSTFQTYLSFNNEEGQQGQSWNLTEDFVNKIRDLTLEIEDALDEFMFEVPFHFHSTKFTKYLHDGEYFFKNRNAIDKLSRLGEEIQNKNKNTAGLYRSLFGSAAPPSMTGDSLTGQSFEGDKMVGFKTRREDLLQQLIGGDSKRATIQVVGPGGSGKTFLVNNVFRDAGIKKKFPCKAWSDMSRNFNGTEGLLVDLLKEFCSRRVVEEIHDHQSGSIGEKLHRYLEDKSYLIVLDNVRRKQDYANVAKFLPSGFKGSRIIITTRNSNVDERPDHTHKLDGLTEEEALELFRRKAFPQIQGNKTYPEELRELSKQIIDRCDRLPLAISAVGSLLSRKQPIIGEWKRFCNNIESEIKNHDASLFNRILKPSFVDLAEHLKSCFFYFSMFPEGHSIKRGRLLRSWIGEGFVEEVSRKTLEEVAETYLHDLIARSLVRVSTLEIDGRVRSCNVLRLHHEFIVELYGKKENFVTVIDEHNPSFNRVRKARRLSVHHDNITTELSKISDDLTHVRSLFAFGHKDVSPKKSSILPFVVRKRIPGTTENQMENMLHKFRLLKVLDLQGMSLNYVPKDIGSFVLLRCLNLRQTNIKTVPRSIKKLSFLEILDLKYTLVTELPEFIYKLQKLSHLLVSFRGSRDYVSSGEAQGVKVCEGIGALSKSLQKVSLINVRNHTKFIEELGELTQLRKLGLADIKRESGVQVLRSIQNMINLMTLDLRARESEYLDLNDDMEIPHEHIQHLYLKGRLESLPRWISSTSLPSLVKVVLKGSKLNGDQSTALDALGALRSLMELKMIEYYTGERLVFKSQMFKKLKKLHVEKFEQLIEVSLESEALAMLEKLTVCHCKQLKPLPCSYRLGVLKEFIVYDMSEDFIRDVGRRIDVAELVDHRVETINHFSSSEHGVLGITSRRYYS
ncbi:hypothetical protein TIFTF001_002529 [Ficus carica]|uniref:Uncharacterized protein n=1 Tax=Ficus carica TaxID=3494 RepID=A0AA87Z474_FICCA|nr:hypothetical protein TIFTF001_002529 [Ficus carica]